MSHSTDPVGLREAPKLEFIDALRGLAIIGVVAVHSRQAVGPDHPVLANVMSVGLRGVQLFYIASAVTLCLSWHARQGRERNPVRNFFIRRWFRISPLFLIAIATYLSLDGFAARYWAPNGIRPWFVAATAFLSHGFHPETINSIVPGGWSIAVEATFYALFPWLIRMGVSLRRLMTLLVIALLTYVINRLYLTEVIGSFYPAGQRYIADDFTTLNFLGQAPVFVIGMITHHVMRRRPKTSALIGAACSGAVVGLAAMILVPSRVGYLLASNPVVAAVGMSWFVVALERWPVKVFVNPLTTYLGRVSYGLYLCHSVVIEALLHCKVAAIVPSRNVSSVVLLLTTLACGAALSSALYVVVEGPGIALGRHLIRALDRRPGPSVA